MTQRLVYVNYLNALGAYSCHGMLLTEDNNNVVFSPLQQCIYVEIERNTKLGIICLQESFPYVEGIFWSRTLFVDLTTGKQYYSTQAGYNITYYETGELIPYTLINNVGSIYYPPALQGSLRIAAAKYQKSVYKRYLESFVHPYQEALRNYITTLLSTANLEPSVVLKSTPDIQSPTSAFRKINHKRSNSVPTFTPVQAFKTNEHDNYSIESFGYSRGTTASTDMPSYVGDATPLSSLVTTPETALSATPVIEAPLATASETAVPFKKEVEEVASVTAQESKQNVEPTPVLDIAADPKQPTSILDKAADAKQPTPVLDQAAPAKQPKPRNRKKKSNAKLEISDTLNAQRSDLEPVTNVQNYMVTKMQWAFDNCKNKAQTALAQIPPRPNLSPERALFIADVCLVYLICAFNHLDLKTIKEDPKSLISYEFLMFGLLNITAVLGLNSATRKLRL